MSEPNPNPTDEQLMAAYVAGDSAAFRALFERYALPLHRMVLRRLGSEADARDVVQQTFLQMHRARNDFHPGARLRPWLFTIAMNLVRGSYRTAGRRREQSLDDRTPEPRATSAEQQPENARLSGEAQQRVRAALASLPEAQRVVIELHWWGECPYEEIAPIVGASVAAVRVRAHRGYERLRQILPEHE
jgi:RNA polymerase sigma factor (sigma-70 family)